jgi:hypothetical protein
VNNQLCALPALSLLLATATVAQNVAFPVTDLLAPGTRASAPRTWVRRVAIHSDNPHRVLVGEPELLGKDEETPEGHFTADGLLSVIARLAELDERAIAIHDVGGGAELFAPASAAGRIEATLAWLRSQLPPGIDLDVRLERVAGERPTPVLGGREVVPSGGKLVLTDVTERAVLVDFDVEIAQAAASASPRTVAETSGSCLVLRPRPAPDRAQCVVEAVVRVAKPSAGPETIDLRHEGFGRLDRISQEFTECAVAFIVPRGGSTTHEWTAPDGSTLRLVCSARWEVPRPTPAPMGDAVVRASTLFGGATQGFRTSANPEDSGEVARDERLVSLTNALLQGGATDGIVLWEAGDIRRAGVVVLEGPTAAGIDASVARAAAAALEPLELSLSVLELPAAAKVEPNGPLPEGGRELVRLSGPLLAGPPLCFTGLREKSYVATWQVEVAQSSRIPDPVIRWLEEGYTANLRAVPDGNGGVRGLEVELELSKLERIDRQESALDLAMRAPESVTISGNSQHVSGSLLPATLLPQNVVAIEKPSVRHCEIAAMVPFGGDSVTVIERTAVSFSGEGRRLVVVGRVRRR